MPIKISANYKNAFQPSDIRGVYPTEIDEEVTYLVARGFVDEYKHKSVLVARDMRLSSPALYEAFCKGVTDAGADVIDLGLVHTPVLYFASGTLNLPGVMITASHSPKEYNGLKLVLEGASPLTEALGLKQIRKRIEKGVFVEVNKRGKIRTKDILTKYKNYVLKGINKAGLNGLKIVADVGNGMAHTLMPALQDKIPAEFTILLNELDGRFPNRGSDPTQKRHQKHITKKLKEGSYDFGMAFDGDADRIGFLDEKGNFVNSAAIGALIVGRLLKKQPKSKIIYTMLTSRIFEETIKTAGGTPIPARVGHAFIKKTMRKRNAIFSCEHSGHYYYKEYFFTDSVVHTLRYVLEAYVEAKSLGLSFSQMCTPYTLYTQTQDVMVEVHDKKKAMKEVEKYLLLKKPLKVKRIDGLWVDYGLVWGVVKPSVTEHALNIMFESKNKAKAEALQSDLVSFVKNIAKE